MNYKREDYSAFLRWAYRQAQHTTNSRYKEIKKRQFGLPLRLESVVNSQYVAWEEPAGLSVTTIWRVAITSQITLPLGKEIDEVVKVVILFTYVGFPIPVQVRG